MDDNLLRPKSSERVNIQKLMPKVPFRYSDVRALVKLTLANLRRRVADKLYGLKSTSLHNDLSATTVRHLRHTLLDTAHRHVLNGT